MQFIAKMVPLNETTVRSGSFKLEILIFSDLAGKAVPSYKVSIH